MKKLLLIVSLFITPFILAQNTPLFEQGKERYKEEKFQDAVASWKKVLEDGEHSAALYFNLGNAYYKLNNIGPSIYYYEKALQLDPNDSDIKTNLAFAENARIDAIEPLPKTIFSKWYQNMAGLLSFDGWAIAAVVCSILFVSLFLLYYFSSFERKKRLFFASSVTAIFLLLGSLTMAFLIHNDVMNDRPAIIFSEVVEVKAGPTMGSEVAFNLHEGTKVQITAEDGDWVRVELVDGKDGWVPASDLKEL